MPFISISVATSCFCFARPQSQVQARSKTQRHSSKRNPNSKFKPKRSTKYEPLSVSAPSSGVEATTYTRLLPKQDFPAPSSESSREIKLFDSDIAQFNFKDLSETETDSGEEEAEEGLQYEQFELFDGNSEYEDEGEEDFYYDWDGKIVNFPNGDFKLGTLSDNEAIWK
ncbi:hypothetical protein SLA2020_370810 [Shorea laevis]